MLKHINLGLFQLACFTGHLISVIALKQMEKHEMHYCKTFFVKSCNATGAKVSMEDLIIKLKKCDTKKLEVVMKSPSIIGIDY